MKKSIFYFDFLSPYVCMIWDDVMALDQKREVDLAVKPVLFAALLNSGGAKGPAEIPAKRNYVWKEVLRWGKMQGIEIKGPPSHPFLPLPSLRLMETVESSSDKLKLGRSITRASWVEGRDIADLKILEEIANRTGFDGKKLISQINTDDIKNKIRQNTEEAISKGVFGVPTLVVDHEIFWGHDRVEQFKKYIKGELNIDPKKLEEMLNRPRSVDRKEVKG